MEMNKTLDLDVSLPGQGPLESLFTSMLPGGGDIGGSGGAPPPHVGFFPAMPSTGPGDQDNASSPGGRGPKSPRAEAAAAGGAAERLTSVKSEAMSQQPARNGSGAEPMDMQQPSESTARGGSSGAATAQQAAAQQRQQAAAGSPPLAAQQQPSPPLVPAPTPLVKTVTLEQMQQQFARAMRQEISFAELEAYLKQYNLLPSGSGGGAAGAAAAAMAGMAGAFAGAAGACGKDLSGGLDDMQTIEQALPSGSDFNKPADS